MSKWLYIPAPAATGPLQTITWTMTGAGTATVSSTGLNIINPNQTDALQYDGARMRLWNGEESATATGFNMLYDGKYYFLTGTYCRQWWLDYSVSATLNGGTSISLNSASDYGSGEYENITGAVQGNGQETYINLSLSVKATALVSGDVVVFTVTAFP